MRYALLFVAAFALSGAALAQVGNDECINAIELGSVSDYCSGAGAFTNAGATDSGLPQSECHPAGGTADVWFSFRPTGTNAGIRVLGQLSRNPRGQLLRPQFALYDASCTNPTELACASDGFGSNLVESITDSLEPGALYFLRVSGRDSLTGSFELCISSFDFVPEPRSDCREGVLLCDKSSFVVTQLIGSGEVTDEITRDICIQEEFGSAWYRWTCETPGTLGLTLTPTNPTDDLDFAVYELPGGIDDCAGKRVLRCVASGENVGEPFAAWERCTGATGLRDDDPQDQEQPGCQPGDDNFAASLDMVAGRSYALVVNNFSQSGNGFEIDFSGTGTFRGPTLDFTVSPETGNQCDADEIRITNNSSVTPGAVGTYDWFFGSFASIAQASGFGPYDITYGSFGEKTITLRVTSSEGCVLTESQTIFIEPCCEISDPLVVNEPDGIDPICPGTPTGGFSTSVASGEPDFFYSIDGGPFLADDEFDGLFAGNYTVFAQNVKGCRDTVDVDLVDPPAISVEVGGDINAELGESFEVEASTQSSGMNSFVWTGVDSIVCLDAACSRVSIYATNPGELMVQLISEAGCTASDLLQIDVRKVRPLYVPTAFSPNGDGINDGWTLYGPEGTAILIRSVQVFDRWGSQVWAAENLPLNDPMVGWDGKFRGEQLRPAVFAFLAEVEYIDGTVLPVTGDINLIR